MPPTAAPTSTGRDRGSSTPWRSWRRCFTARVFPMPATPTRGCSSPGTGSQRMTHPKEDVMPQEAWSDKRERQYEHIKEGLQEHGRPEDLAEEIAARTVNKERARSGEARERSRSSTQDISSGRRGGLRSHTGPGGRTYEQLYNEAKECGLEGR